MLSECSHEKLLRATFSDLVDPPYDYRGTFGYSGNFAANGVAFLPGFFSEDEIAPYVARRGDLPKDRSQKNNYFGGWSHPTPFMHEPALRDLACSTKLSRVLASLCGEQMALNLALTGWVSTERKWHQDAYLNPSELGPAYVAVWIALEDVDPNAGPFEYVLGSSRWPVLSRAKLFAMLTPEERQSPHWPTFTQDEIARVCIEEMNARDARPIPFLARKGDILIWHASLMHQGSIPKDRTLERRALICHYSSIAKRSQIDFTSGVLQHKDQGYYFNLPTDGSVRP